MEHSPDLGALAAWDGIERRAPTRLANPICPNCDSDVYVSGTRRSEFNVYFRCAQCGEIWTIDKESRRQLLETPTFTRIAAAARIPTTIAFQTRDAKITAGSEFCWLDVETNQRHLMEIMSVTQTEEDWGLLTVVAQHKQRPGEEDGKSSDPRDRRPH